MTAPQKGVVRRADVQAQATAMVGVARAQFGNAFDDLRTDPCATLTAWAEVEFQYVTNAGGAPDDERCSVAGAYIENFDTGAPIVQVELAASAGRRAFTALHELGHHLQRTDVDLLKGTWAQRDNEFFEDLACDAFAAAILLPEENVTRYIDAAGPTVDDVVRLYEASSASRSAVCVRAAQRLPAPGHVVLLTDEGDVFFSSSRDLPPLRRGSDQAGDSLITRALTNGRSSGRGRFTYRDGIRGGELFIQAATFDGDLLLLIAVTDSAPWEGFALPSKDVGPEATSYECSDLACGATYESWERRCPKCSMPPCTDCGRCGCTTTSAERQCTTCWLMKPAATFNGDTCADCD